jgi:hypothetical protein
MSKTREKFATQVDAEILATVRKIAEEEGRQIQALMDEALRDLIEKRQLGRARRHVVTAYLGSLAEYDELYKKLAK